MRQDDEGDHCGPSRDLPCYTYYNVSSPTLVPYLAKAGTGTGAAVVVAPGGGCVAALRCCCASLSDLLKRRCAVEHGRRRRATGVPESFSRRISLTRVCSLSIASNSYSVLSYNKEGEDVAAYYQSIGVSAFLLKYRVPARPDMEGLPHWWAGLQDAQRAISLVREGVKDGKWSINASMVGFTGFSAGGHLTGHVSTAAERAYAKVDAADEQSHLPNFALFIYPWMLLPNNAAAEWGQPYALADEFANSVTADHPVSFFAHNEDDGVAPCENTIVYHQKLKSVGAAMSTLFVANEGGHGFGLCQELTGNEEICQWWGLAKKWLQDHGLTVNASS